MAYSSAIAPSLQAASAELPATASASPGVSHSALNASPPVSSLTKTSETITRESDAPKIIRGVSLSERSKEDAPQGAPAMRRPSLSQHPFFAAKARGFRARIARFTPSWYSVTMVSSRGGEGEREDAAECASHRKWDGAEPCYGTGVVRACGVHLSSLAPC